MNRREFSQTLAVAAAAGVTVPRELFAAAQSNNVFDWRPVNESMRVAFGAGGNALVVTGGGQSVLIDTKNAGYGQALRAEAEAFGGPLEHVINTHHHGDHTGGNPLFVFDVGVISQARGAARAEEGGNNTLRAIQQDPVGRLESMTNQVRDMDISAAAKNQGADSVAEFIAIARDLRGSAFAATETFDVELEVQVGDTSIELRHIDRGHTDNDIFVYVPEANVIHGGDLFFNGIHPYIDVGADATTVGWQRCLAAMIGLCDTCTTVIPGHGDISDVDGLYEFSKYFDTLREVVEREIGAGKSKEQIMELQPPEFRDMPPRRLNQNLGIVYDELTSG